MINDKKGPNKNAAKNMVSAALGNINRMSTFRIDYG